MSSLNYQADFNDVDSGGDYTPIPPADYQVTCVEATLQNTKAGTGQYIKMMFEVMNGQFQGRKIFHNITFQNPSAKAQEIGRKQLNGYMLACNIQSVQDTSQLSGYAVIASVKIKDDPQYGKQNTIAGFKAIGGQAPAQPQQQPVQQAPPPPVQQPNGGYDQSHLPNDPPF